MSKSARRWRSRGARRHSFQSVTVGKNRDLAILRALWSNAGRRCRSKEQRLSPAVGLSESLARSFCIYYGIRDIGRPSVLLTLRPPPPRPPHSPAGSDLRGGSWARQGPLLRSVPSPPVSRFRTRDLYAVGSRSKVSKPSGCATRAAPLSALHDITFATCSSVLHRPHNRNLPRWFVATVSLV